MVFYWCITYKSRRLRRDMTAVMLGGEATRRTTANNITNAAMLQLKRCGIAAFCFANQMYAGNCTLTTAAMTSSLQL